MSKQHSQPPPLPPLQPPPETMRVLASLREAVRDAFEKKRRLGQYAVVWKDGEILTLRGEQLAADKPADDDNR